MTDVRLLNEHDLPELTALLWTYCDTSLFILGNLQLSGLEQGDKPYFGCYYGGFVEGELKGVIVRYWNGNCMPQGETDVVMDIWTQSAELRSSDVKGFVGQYELCRELRNRLLRERNQTSADLALNSREVLYSLALDDLQMPAIENLTLSPASEADMSFLLPWMIDYNVEALNATRNQALAEDCHDSLRQRISLGNCFVLRQGLTPVATTGFNARVHPMIQVGGVFTPECYRGQGFARAAVALSLQQMRNEGFGRCVLFTDEENAAARRAYERIGFQLTGSFGLFLF